jgi:hypothetical protein
MMGEKRYFITLVHGTFAPGASWMLDSVRKGNVLGSRLSRKSLVAIWPKMYYQQLHTPFE